MGLTILSRLPWLKMLPGLIALALVGIVVFQTHNLNNAREKIDALRTDRGVLAAELGVKPDHQLMLQKLRAVRQESANRKATLDTINREAVAAKVRADAADARLKAQQEQHRKDYAKAQQTISALQGRTPTGDTNADRKLIEEDSKAPWKNWRMFNRTSSTKMDNHVFEKREWNISTVIVHIVKYKNYEDLRAGAERIYKVKIPSDFKLYGFMYPNKGVCEIHTLDPEIQLETAIIGHELLHCFYGTWHESRI